MKTTLFCTGLFLGILIGCSSFYIPNRFQMHKEIDTLQQDSIQDSIKQELDTVPVKLEQPEFFLADKPTIELLKQACDYYQIKYPNIVIAQAILETGHFKSNLCVNGNNLFGLYNSHKRQYYRFNHWTESVKAYRDLVQYRYKSGDYYTWLVKIRYASDPKYINRVKQIQKDNNL